MSRRFDRATAKTYTFKDTDGDRELIAIYIGGKRVGFIELDTAHRFAERISGLAKSRRGNEDNTSLASSVV